MTKLYIISPANINININEYASSLEEVLETGLVACFQLRLKNLNDQELINISKVLKPICNKFDVPFILNDRLDLALSLIHI